MREDAVKIGRKTPFGEAARAVIRKLLGQMMDNLDSTLLGEDIEALHDMRVASRRLRAALRVFRPCLSKNRLAPVVARVRSVTAALGMVRDQDVFLDYLRKRAAEREDLDIGWLIEREEHIREGARLAMSDSLSELEAAGLPDQVEDLLAGAKMTTTTGGKRGAEFARQAPDMIEARLDEMRALSGAIEDPANVEGLHRMRIAAKRLRYTMEAFAPCFGRPLLDKIAAIKLLQEQLGQIHDSDVWMEKLRQYRDEPGLSEDRLSAIDQLIAERQEHRESTYKEALAHWRGLVGARFAQELMKLVRSGSGEQEAAQVDGEVRTMPKNGKRKAGTADGAEEQAAVAAQPEVEAAPTPADSLGETIGQTKEAMAAAAGRLAEKDGAPAKLAKQFTKIEALLGSLPEQAAALGPDEAAKAVKRLSRLRDEFAAVTSDDSTAAPDLKKFRRRIRSLRKKLVSAASDG